MGQTHAESDEALWSQWMTQAQQGQEQSYRLLLEALGHVIEKYLRGRFGALDFLEDCVQECLLAIHQGRHTYNNSRPFRPWMFAIVRHKVIDMLRKRDVRSRHLVANTVSADGDDGDDVIDRQPDHSNRIEDVIESEEFFHNLTPQFRQALILTKVVGLSIRESAQRLGVSEAAMKVRVHRAMQELRRELET